ncbi:hypothetical protein D9M72_439360 [compost metagenome]
MGLLRQFHHHVAVGPRPGSGGVRGDLQVLAHAVRVFVVLQHGNVHGGLAQCLGGGHAVIPGNGCLQGHVIADVHPDGGLGRGAAVIDDRVADVDRTLAGRRLQDDAAARLAHGGLEFRGRLDPVPNDADGVAVGVGVVPDRVHRNLAARTDLDVVVNGSGFLVRIAAGRDAHGDRAGIDGALPVHHLVTEGVSARAVARRGEVDEVAADSGGAHIGGAVDAGQLDGVAVGIDAVQVHRNADRPGGHHPCRQVLWLRPGVLRAFQRQDVDRDGRGALLALRVHGVVDGTDSLGLGPGDEPERVFGDEAFAVRFRHCLRQHRIHR